MKMLRALMFVALFLVGTLGIGSTTNTHAQSQKRGTVIRLKDFTIVGRIQKPQAFYVLSRAPLNYKSFQFKESFVKKVIQAVKQPPF